MHTLLVIGGILGLLAIAGGPGLVVFVVRAGLVLTIAAIAWAVYVIEKPPTAQEPPWAEYCRNSGKCPDTWPGDPWAAFHPSWKPPPPATKPAAIPAPRQGPYDRPLYYPWLPEKPEPQSEPSKVEMPGWGVDDLSGPWPSQEIKPASGRADKLLHRLHEAQGIGMGP